ncbi:MAG TPA: F0F1 ATP synthase subunit B [Phycisphaerae bacterium]|nr:F0F1 ATP synthase subunit B [Phycisphaerae bacterium]HOJ74795.1 F0F1 ATP synthase subunit B [Phycisphaerae bacterium]HOM51958.1 F0F1 ATP synthase subunit B [Phycisphaerae bacterium]HOQ85647.1 F0F1 ATP synthase subunit B [Phycisphaerae bacterium]HPP27418.1 F0F1 ATP synthase subunit B [Phycisphaerae bacterium]
MRSRTRAFIGLVSILALAPAVWAADAAHGDGKISPFTGDLGNAIWTLLIFGLVLFVLGKFAWGPILTGLQRRERFIRESLETAKRDREAAEARLREYEQKLAEAREEASRLVEEGRRDAEVTRRKIEEEARAASEAMIERAKREIGVARDTALRDLYETSAELATSMASGILRRQITPEDHSRMVQDALAQLQGRVGSNGG